MLEYPVPKIIKERTFQFFFPTLRLPSQEASKEELKIFKEYSKLIDLQFRNCDVAVLYKITRDFREFLEKFNLDVGKKEVIIYTSGKVRFFPDYSTLKFETVYLKGFKWHKKS